MSQGLSAAISGIRINQSKIDVVSDNIANMNTVAFKSSLVNFENVFVKTLTSGTAPGANIGGTNPMQIGLGATISEITRNFSGGTVQTTGRPNDLNIQGSGFFTLQDSAGGLLLTRAGNFSLDSDGYLSNPQGLKVIGTTSITSTTGSSIPVRVPQALRLDVSTTTATGGELLRNLDTKTITPGTFTLTVGGVDYPVTVSSTSTINSVLASIPPAASISSSITAGQVTLSSASAISFGSATDTSNFLDVVGLSLATDIVTGGNHTYASNTLNGNAVTIRPSDSTDTTYQLTAFSVSRDGAVEATYANGDKITVSGDTTRELLYKTSTGRNIVGDGITVIPNAATAAELQLQMANVINPKGLVFQSGNLFTIGPNAGYATFSVGQSGGMGSIQSGGLESSNVDLPTEFSDMILAQRGIDANSRTFDAVNQIMRTIVNIGR